MATFQPFDVIRRSASVTATPAANRGGRGGEADRHVEVHRLQGLPVGVPGMERHARGVGVNVGVYDNPHDLTPNMFTLMRFTEWENPKSGNLEWLIRKDGCMHCEDPGCLKACPAPGAIVQYANGIVDFVHENCIGCGYCVKGCPFNIPRISQVDHKAYKCTLCSDRVAVGQQPACAKACPTHCISFGTKEEMSLAVAEADHGPQVARVRPGGALQSAGRERHARHVRAASRRPAAPLRRPSRQPEDQPDRRAVEGGRQVCRPGA